MLVLKVITNNRYIYENSNHEQMWPFECCTGGRHKLIVSTAEGSQSTQLAAQIIPEIENNRFKFLKQTVQNSKIANIEILDIKMTDKIFPSTGCAGEQSATGTISSGGDMILIRSFSQLYTGWYQTSRVSSPLF